MLPFREYRPGDNIKTIHWKASQKTGETMIRELSLPVEHQVLLRYENPTSGETEPAQIHSMTTVILSISAMLAEQGIIHDLGWRDALWQIDSEDARLAAMDALLSAGMRIPQDICVTGYDGVELAQYLRVPLTTVNQPFYEIGKQGTEILLDRIKYRDMPVRKTVLKSRLVCRESSMRRKPHA